MTLFAYALAVHRERLPLITLLVQLFSPIAEGGLFNPACRQHFLFFYFCLPLLFEFRSPFSVNIHYLLTALTLKIHCITSPCLSIGSSPLTIDICQAYSSTTYILLSAPLISSFTRSVSPPVGVSQHRLWQSDSCV